MKLVLPPGYSSRDVQLTYFLTGSFGGYGSTAVKRSESTLTLRVAREGQRAEEVKIVAYLPGCEFFALEIDLRDAREEERLLECVTLAAIPLEGRITSVPRIRAARVHISYECSWCHSFFGVKDGMVPTFQLGTTALANDGRFAVTVPDFARDATVARFDYGGALQLTLRHGATGNIIGRLQPMSGELPWLPVRSEYPAPLGFRFVKD